MREMKDSGVEWIGEIPKDWKCCKVKYSTSFVGSGTTPTSSNQDFYDGDINWIQSGDLYKTVVVDTVEKKLTEKALKSFSALHIYQAPFIIMAMYGASVGNTAFSKIDACCNQACCCIKNNEFFNLKFMFYWLDFAQIDFLGRAIGGTQPNISQDKIKNQYIVKPSLEEQQQIADYLDTQCSEIDATAEDIQKEIALLEDYKKSVITEAMTKGLNPDAEMKDSGIAWIGDIPKDWDLLKIGYVTKEISDIDHYMPSDSDDIDKVPYLMIGDLKENISQIDFESCKYISKKVYRALSIKSKPEKGNVIFARYATIGTVCFVDSEKQLLVSYACLTVKANELIKGRFLFYYFKSNAFLEEVSQYVKSNTQGNIGKESLIRAKIVVPKLKEQTQIISYLDSKCSEIDAIIADKKRQRGILAEYKKSLIYEYVTGKKEVPINE